MFWMKLLSFPGSISYLISENVGGIILDVIFYYQIFLQLHLDCGFKRLGLIPYDFWGKEGKKSILEWEIWTCHKKWGIMVYI
jgi:hypothetical protein